MISVADDTWCVKENKVLFNPQDSPFVVKLIQGVCGREGEKEFYREILLPGDYFGEEYLTSKKLESNIVTLTNCELEIVHRPTEREILPKLEERFKRMRRFFDFSVQRSEEKIALTLFYLQDTPFCRKKEDIWLFSISHLLISRLAGVSRETVTRTLAGNEYIDYKPRAHNYIQVNPEWFICLY